jgi:hypothetical protein
LEKSLCGWWWWVVGVEGNFSVSFGPNPRFKLWIWAWTKLNKNLAGNIFTPQWLTITEDCKPINLSFNKDGGYFGKYFKSN